MHPTAAAPVAPLPPPDLLDPSTPFRWAVGVEGSFIPHLGIDQYEWTQHDRCWREDFRLIAADLRCRWCRYPVPWHTLEPTPGVFDWTWTDARFDLADELGLRLMVDLAHFGTPTWLPDAFADPEFPEAIRRFSRAFGQRYAGRPCVPTVCPVNEPLITALFCGDIGLWPPYGRGLDNYMTVLSRIAQGICLGVRELRDTMPGVEILVSDSLEVAATAEPESSEKTSPFLRESLGADVARRMERRHIVMDLVLGNLAPRHPLHDWMRRHGFAHFDVRWFDRNRQRVDLVGLDYYPHTEVELYTSPEGYYRQRCPERPLGLHRAAQDYWHRHGLPLMITETSVTGADHDKLDWLQRSTDDVRRLRAEGFPIVGYTWWPAIDHVDWDGAMLHQTGHVHPVGIYRLERGPGGQLRRVPTGLRDAYRALIDGGNQAAGELVRKAGGGARGDVDHDAAVNSTPTRPASRRASGNSALSLVFFSREPWTGVWTRPQQLASRLQLRGAVLFVDPVKWTFDGAPASTALQAIPHFPNLHVLTPRLPDELRTRSPETVAGELRRLVALALGRAPLAGRFAAPAVHWFDDPAAVPAFLGWEGLTAARSVVYDCREKWTAFPGADPALADAERRLLGAADVTFTRGRRLFDELRAGNVARRVEFLPDGVDAHGYIRATRRQTAVPHDGEFIKRPTLGYLGRVDGRLDFGLIGALADADPDWNLVFIGPVGADLNPAHLPRRQNVYWLGARPPERLPDYLKGLDLVILPYAEGGANPWHVPAKLPEALLGGRPVVASAGLPEIAADPLFVDCVDVGATPEEFVHLCRQTIQSPDPKRRREVMRGVVARHWRQVVAQVEELPEETVSV